MCECGGSHEDGSCAQDGGASAQLLLGFLSDFRTESAPKPAPPKRTPRHALVPEPAVSPVEDIAAPPSWEEPAFDKPEPPCWPAPDNGASGITPPLQPTWQPPSQYPTWQDSTWQASPPIEHWPPPGPGPAYGGPPPPGTFWQPGLQGHAPRSRARVVFAVIVGVALLGAAVAGIAIKRSVGGPSYPAAWDPRVAPIAQFVQTQRGLAWKHPVKVNFLPRAQFDALMAKENSPDAKAVQDAQSIFNAMRALGVASGNVDLAKSAQQFAQADVVGQYVDSDRAVYVRGDQLTPYVRSVLAHELTHALQAEYFDLEKMKSGHADDDSAVTALIEGDAVRVQNAYEQSLSSADQEQLAQEQEQGSSQAKSQTSQEGIPQFMIDQAQFPYDFGPTFVDALVGEGGNSKVDAAFRNPPTLDGQIVDPESYTAGTPVPTVTVPPLPKNASRIAPPTGFGEVTLLEMLGDQIGFGPAWSAVQGWMQDQILPYRLNGQVCVEVAVLNDSPSSAGSLADAGTGWAKQLPSASVTQSGTVVDFQACDPGPGWKPNATGQDPYDALALRSALIDQLIIDGHLDATKATCASDQVLTAIGPQALQDAEQSSDENSPAVQRLSSALKDAVPVCA